MKKLWVTFMITVMAGYIIGLNMLSPINSSISVIVTPKFEAHVVGMTQLLPIFALIIIIIDSVIAIDDHHED